MQRIVTFLLLVTLAGCPKGKGGSSTSNAHMPAGVQTYAALRWVPADASYVVSARSATDAVALMRDLAEVAGIAFGADLGQMSAASRQELGYDILSAEGLEAIGIDPAGGVAVYSQGFSPTIVARLGDPDRMQGFIETLREDVSVSSEIADGAEVFTVRIENQLFVSWTVVDGWVIAHAGITLEHEASLGWLKTSKAAAGAFAGTDDYAAAMASAKERAAGVSSDGAPPVFGVLHPATVIDAWLGFFDPSEQQVIGACVAPLRTSPRVLLAAGSGTGGTQAAIVAEDAGGISSMLLAAPGAWYGVREGAPLQIDLALDLAAVAAATSCPVGSDITQLGLRTAHVATHAFDGAFPTRAALYADLTSERALKSLINDIPGVGSFSKRTKIGGEEVIHIDVPFIGIEAYYQLTSQRAVATMSEDMMGALLAKDGAGSAPPGELLHVAVRPHDINEDAWDALLQYVLGMESDYSRETAVRMLYHWDAAAIDAVVTGDDLVITASGLRHH